MICLSLSPFRLISLPLQHGSTALYCRQSVFVEFRNAKLPKTPRQGCLRHCLPNKISKILYTIGFKILYTIGFHGTRFSSNIYNDYANEIAVKLLHGAVRSTALPNISSFGAQQHPSKYKQSQCAALPLIPTNVMLVLLAAVRSTAFPNISSHSAQHCPLFQHM